MSHVLCIYKCCRTFIKHYAFHIQLKSMQSISLRLQDSAKTIERKIIVASLMFGRSLLVCVCVCAKCGYM